MMFLIICGVILLLTGAFFLWLAYRGRDPRNLAETVGELTKRQHFKNVQVKSYRVKNLTDYAYTYTVGGRTYRLSGTQWTHPRALLRKCTVVYLKGFPRLAYIGQFTGIQESLIGVSFLILGILCLWISTHVQ